MARKLTREKFQAWLEHKKPRAVVGYKSAHDYCPLSMFFREMYDIHYPSVGSENYTLYAPWGGTWATNKDLPPWAKRFVALADKAPYEGITAQRALTILRRVKHSERKKSKAATP